VASPAALARCATGRRTRNRWAIRPEASRIRGGMDSPRSILARTGFASRGADL